MAALPERAVPVVPAATAAIGSTRSAADEVDEAADEVDEGDVRNRVAGLVRELPEIYQPIFGHSEIVASRTADDYRIDVMTQAVGDVSSHLDRPLRILDLGSAQGYIAFRLAQLGHSVTGIESLPQNLAVSRSLQEEHAGLDVEFLEGDIVDCRSLVNLSDYDMVIGFSVLHHVAHRDGHEAAVELVSTLVGHIPFAIFEMAVTSEPVYWADSLPADPRVTLAPYAFVREIGLVGTHLSDIRRPLLFASSTHVLTKAGLEAIESWKTESHADLQGATLGLRRYYFVASGIMKVIAQFTDNPDEALVGQFRQEQRREAHVLEALGQAGIEAPEILEFADGARESILLRTAYPGILLSEAIDSIDEDAKSVITAQVLDALAMFETQGLYHADLRLWNVVLNSDEGVSHIIDYGALSPLPEDVMWPNDAYFSFLVWLVSLWGSFSDQPGLVLPRFVGIDRAEFPARVISLISTLMTHPRDRFVFRDLCAYWKEPPVGDTTAVWPTSPLAWGWLSTIEHDHAALAAERDAVVLERDFITSQREAVASQRDAVASQRDVLAAEREVVTSQRDTLASERDGLASELDALRSAYENLRVEHAVSEAHREATHTELVQTRKTLSWRITRPLRGLRRPFRK